MRKLGVNVIPQVMVVLCFLVAIVQGEDQELKTFTAEYGPFDDTYFETFEVIPPATISNGALQLTPDSFFGNPNSSFRMTYNSARILLKQPFQLWKAGRDDNGVTNVSQPNVASFNTSFLVNVYRLMNQTSSEGFAFVIAPDLFLPPSSTGQFLGLTNSLTDGSDTNHLVAVELDTFKQGFDPDDNHVGLDINSVRSTKTESLTPHNITIAPHGARFYNVWIDYDGLNKLIQVFIAEQAEMRGPTTPKPRTPILSAALNLRDHVNQQSYFGFSASSGLDFQLNVVLRWNLTVHHFSKPEDGKHRLSIKTAVVIGVPALLLLLMCAGMLGYYIHKKQMAHSNASLVGILKCLPGTPREFKFRGIKRATNNFDEKNKLGQGGFGVVYKGLLVKENMEVAVKCFTRESINGQGDFLAELIIINRLRHKHLVKLLGWCHKNGKLFLVYEYMQNGSLDKHLFVGPKQDPLKWDLRYKIVSGVASGLHYLHDEFDQRVIHRDLKASNIMLDSNFNARLGDFGLARALDNEKTSYAEAEGVQGTLGYIAPECFLTGKATRQSDVYAFGAVLLEVVCGQRPGSKINAGFKFLVDWVWSLHREGRLLDAVDQRLGDNYVTEEAERLLLLGLSCSHPITSERPKTHAILQIISGTMQVPVVPSFKPAFVWPAANTIDVDPNSANTMSISIICPR